MENYVSIIPRMGRQKENKFRGTITLGPVGEKLLIQHSYPGRGVAITAALMLWDKADDKIRVALIQIARMDFPNEKELRTLFEQMLTVSDEKLLTAYGQMLDAFRDDKEAGKSAGGGAPHNPPKSPRIRGR